MFSNPDTNLLSTGDSYNMETILFINNMTDIILLIFECLEFVNHCCNRAWLLTAGIQFSSKSSCNYGGEDYRSEFRQTSNICLQTSDLHSLCSQLDDKELLLRISMIIIYTDIDQKTFNKHQRMNYFLIQIDLQG